MTQKPAPRNLTERLASLRDGLLANLIERDIPIRLALLAAVAGEHLLLIGPPGTAKSDIAQRLRSAFQNASFFERLLTRFTVPEELFGPMSIKALEADRYERQIQGYLPTASVAFLDEIFKANSAILNALLTLLNERAFDNGTQRIPVPLLCAIGASNELPEGSELEALYDRFLLRCHVGPVSDDGFLGLMALRGSGKPTLDPSLPLTIVDLAQIQQESVKVAVPSGVQGMLAELRKWLSSQDITVSDRRWRKIVSLLQASAYTNGRDQVSVWDGWLLPYCTWNKPEQREIIAAWYEEWVGASEAKEPATFTRLVEVWEARLSKDQNARSQAHDKDGNPLFLDRKKKQTTSATGKKQKHNPQNEPLFLAPPNWGGDRSNNGQGYTEPQIRNDNRSRYNNLDPSYFADEGNWLMEEAQWPPKMEPTRYSQAHIDGQSKQAAQLLDEVNGWEARLTQERDALAQSVDSHLWIVPGFSKIARKQLEAQLRIARDLSKRLRQVAQGFAELPKQHDSSEEEDSPKQDSVKEARPKKSR